MKNILIPIILAGSLFGQSNVTIGGTTYQLKSHPRTLIDGPGGVIDSRIKDPDGAGPLVAPKATSSNPPWVALVSAVAAALPSYQNVANGYNMRDGSTVLQFATYWYADNSQSAAHDAALYMLRHIEYFVPRVCLESMQDCIGSSGASLQSFGMAYWMPNWILAYELMRGELTPSDRQTFADKMLNDNSQWGGIDGSPATSCLNPTANSNANVVISNRSWTVAGGTLSISITQNVTAAITISGSTTGMKAGDYLNLSGGSDSGFGNNSYPILSITGANSFTVGYTPSLSNGDHTAANPNLVLTYLIPYATASAPVFGSTINPGDWIFTPTNSGNVGILATILDSTHAYLGGAIGAVASEAMYSLPHDWSPGQCGFAWVGKHYSWTAQPLAYSSGATLYPPDGGVNGLDSGHNLVYSTLWGLHMIYISMIDDDVNASVRSGAELTAASTFWLANPYALARRFWTGFHQSGSGYGLFRAEQFMPGTALAIESSLVNPPDLLGGNWAKNVMVLNYANAFPGAPSAQMQWGQPDVSGALMSAQNMQGFVMMAYWYRNTPEGAYANWFLQNLWASQNNGFGNTPGTHLGFTASNITGPAPAWFFIFTDQAYPVSSLAGAPTTFTMNSSDTGTAGQRADALISRTGYLSPTDTLLDFHAETIPEFDHNVFANQPSNYGSYKIVKGHYLLAEDYSINFGGTSPGGFTIGGTGSNYVEIGGTPNNVIATKTPIPASIPRALGSNSYAYAMADVTKVYQPAAGVSHGYRHLADFKKPGTSQFIVDYMDFQTAAGMVKTAYYHYPNMAATSLSGTVVSSTNTNGNTTQLLTEVLAPQPVHLATDTSGTSFRLAVCPSVSGTSCDAANTSGEMMVVHMPATGLNNTLPNLSLIAAVDPNFAGIEIDGASPKIGIFPRHGQTYTASSFTASHQGTAQILISGITPTATSGLVYTLLQNGTPVLQHQTAGADTTMYYEGTAGSYQLVADAAPPVINRAGLAPATEYQPYTQSTGAIGGSGTLIWTLSAGSLPAGLSLNSASGAIFGTPVGSGVVTFTLTVTDGLGQTDSAQLSIAVMAAPALQISTSALIPAHVGASYLQTLAAGGGGGNFTWTLQAGNLPAGLVLSSAGVISGVPVAPSLSNFTILVADGFGNQASQPYSLNVTLVPASSMLNTMLSGATQLK